MPLSFNKKPALVAYVTCGDPNLATTREIVLAAIDAGADVIELGVPFSDPVADGPVIQRASQRAIQQGTTLDRKSTRLNSSHLVISYAVFCLKKKMNTITPA